MSHQSTIALVTAYSGDKPAGLERFLLQLLRAIDQHDLSRQLLVYTKKNNGLERDLRKMGAASLKVVNVFCGNFWKEFGLFFTPPADSYIFNSPLVPIFFKPKRYSVIVYDFAYKHFKSSNFKDKLKTLYIDFVSKLAFRRAKLIICISEYTKNDLIKYFKVDASKIQVVYPGDGGLTKEEPVKPNINLSIADKFFLYVGTIKERKNLFGVLSAFAILKKRMSQDIKLVVVGKCQDSSLYAKKLQQLIKQENLDDSVIFAGHISDRELIYLYNNTLALVFPSLLEGFGFPLVEAMSRGVPIVTSENSCLSEITGEAALLVDPLNYSDIAGAMNKILTDDEKREELKVKGLERAKEFTWNKAADNFYNLVRD